MNGITLVTTTPLGGMGRGEDGKGGNIPRVLYPEISFYFLGGDAAWGYLLGKVIYNPLYQLGCRFLERDWMGGCCYAGTHRYSSSFGMGFRFLVICMALLIPRSSPESSLSRPERRERFEKDDVVGFEFPFVMVGVGVLFAIVMLACMGRKSSSRSSSRSRVLVRSS